MRAHTESGNNKHEYFLPIENRISVWPIESFRSLKLGRAARLMMEISDPRVALAISEHANFTFDRLERTNKGNTEIIFGDKETSLRRAKIVNQAHQVNSTDVTGKKYTANDPKLKGFVFDMRTMAVIINHENFVRKLSVREKDAYVRGIKSYGLVMGVPERDSANTWSEVVDRYNRRLREGVIEVSTDALSVSKLLIKPLVDFATTYIHLIDNSVLANILGLTTNLLIDIEKANDLHSLVTRGLLPVGIRSAYGFEWNDNDKRSFQIFSSAIRIINQSLPSAITRIPEYDKKALS